MSLQLLVSTRQLNQLYKQKLKSDCFIVITDAWLQDDKRCLSNEYDEVPSKNKGYFGLKGISSNDKGLMDNLTTVTW